MFGYRGLTFGGASAPSADTLPGLQRWYKASSLSGLADGAELDVWTARSGADLSTHTGTKPVFAANVGGKSAVYFGGFAGMQTPGLALGSFSILLVANWSSANEIYFHAPSTSGYEYAAGYLAGFSGLTRAIYAKRSTSTSTSNASGKKPAVGTAGTWATGLKLFTHEFDGNHSGHLLRLNRVAASLINLSGSYISNPGTTALTGAFDLGRTNLSGATGSIGHAFELLIYSPILSASDRDALELSLSTEYGIA